MINKQCKRCYKKYKLKTSNEIYIHTCTPGRRNKDGTYKK